MTNTRGILALLHAGAQLVAAQLAAAQEPIRFVLPNGLRVWVQEAHARPVALVQVTYKVGSLNESAGTTGIAHYVEHMVYRATENIRNEDIYGYIDRIGGRYTGGTWPDVTRYAETVPSWALESALQVTAERMTRAVFDSAEFERERSNVVTEANGFSDTDPVNAFRDAVMYASFELHPYRYNSNTWARDNRTLTRAEAYDWYRRHYGPNNAVLVIIGDVATSETRRLVEKHFGSLPRATMSGEIKIIEPPQRVEKRVTLSYAGPAKQIEIVYRAPSATHADFPTLVALDHVLGPRLARVAREFRAEITTKDSATSYPFVYRISVRSDSAASLDRIFIAIDAEIDRIANGNVAQEDMAAATREPQPTPRAGDPQSQGSGVPPRRSFLTRIADQLSNREALPWEVSVNRLDSIRAATARVTSADIRDYASRWLRPFQRTVGFLGSGKGDFLEDRVEIPPLTTPPAKRMRPDPVPPRALQPLAPLSIQTARRVLPNGIVVRAARVPGERGALHVRVDYGHVSDAFTGSFSAERIDSAATAAVATVRRMYSTRPAQTTDTSAGARARERLLAGIGPPLVINASMRATVTVSVAGPRPAQEQLHVVAKRLAVLPKNRELRTTEASFAPIVVRNERIAVPGESQVTVLAGLPGVLRDHPDRRALELLNYIVGVPSYGGRLGWALTKSGLTYSAAATTTFGTQAGHIVFSTKCDTRNTDSTVQAIREVIAGIGERGVEDWELREAQAFTLGRTLLYGAREDSGPDAVAAALTDSDAAAIELLDLPALSRAYLSVTLEDINRVAQRYYRPDMLKIVAFGAVPRDGPQQIFPEGTFRKLFER